MNFYTPGQTVVVYCAFTDPLTLEPQTVTTLKVRVLNPAGVETDATLAQCGNPKPGVYTYNVATAISEIGLWNYRFEATAPFTAASEGVFFISPTVFKQD